jgi:hypothetical protein
MTDHDLLLVVVGGFLLQVAGLVLLGWRLGAMVREVRRLTRAVGALVVQESERVRAIMGPGR